MIAAFEAAYRQAERTGELADGLDPRVAALETIMFLGGLLRLWLLGGTSGDYRRNAEAVVRAHVRARRAHAPVPEARGARSRAPARVTSSR
jgi:TetR/AcrR family acrAB operon transcriptional repressor